MADSNRGPTRISGETWSCSRAHHPGSEIGSRQGRWSAFVSRLGSLVWEQAVIVRDSHHRPPRGADHGETELLLVGAVVAGDDGGGLEVAGPRTDALRYGTPGGFGRGPTKISGGTWCCSDGATRLLLWGQRGLRSGIRRLRPGGRPAAGTGRRKCSFWGRDSPQAAMRAGRARNRFG